MQNRPRDGARTHAKIRAAAVALFYQHGYEATSQRMLADSVGIKAGSLYNHIGSKDELLSDIMMSIMDRLLESSREAVEKAGSDPVEQLKALIDNHLRFHASSPKETFIGNSELRSLSPDQRQLILGRRREYELLLKRSIEAAAQFAQLPLLDSRLQTYAVLALGMHLASWFRASREIPLEHVVEVYTELALRQLGLSTVAGVTVGEFPRDTLASHGDHE
jgi:TetR/AcrR family transcriptional regulator, cholesterol catabolism regulator